jgi:AcrR family transcriptional regulator
MTEARTYSSPLRRDQAEATRIRILDAAARLLDRDGADTGLTNRKIAAEAGVTEMTVYRHFPSRTALDEALWRHVNDKLGVAGGFPDRFDAMLERLPALFASFDAAPAHILSTVTSPTGRSMRASQDDVRRSAFLTAVAAGAPDLSQADQRQAAAVLQLLYSAYAWLSLREQWTLEGADAQRAIRWAIQALTRDLQQRGDKPLTPATET